MLIGWNFSSRSSGSFRWFMNSAWPFGICPFGLISLELISMWWGLSGSFEFKSDDFPLRRNFIIPNCGCSVSDNGFSWFNSLALSKSNSFTINYIFQCIVLIVIPSSSSTITSWASLCLKSDRPASNSRFSSWTEAEVPKSSSSEEEESEPVLIGSVVSFLVSVKSSSFSDTTSNTNHNWHFAQCNYSYIQINNFTY